MSTESQRRLGRAQAEADWFDGAVSVLALQDWTSFGEGYRERRRELAKQGPEHDGDDELFPGAGSRL